MTPPDGDVGSALAQLLGGAPPEAVTLLGPDAQHTLLTLVEQAQSQQGRALDEAIDQGLSHLPRLLRGSVRLLLFS